MYDQCTKEVTRGLTETGNNMPGRDEGDLRPQADGNWMTCMNKYTPAIPNPLHHYGTDKHDTLTKLVKDYKYDGGKSESDQEKRFTLQDEMDDVLGKHGPEAFLRAREAEAKGSAWPNRHHALFIVGSTTPDDYGNTSAIMASNSTPGLGPATYQAFMKFKENGTAPEYEDFARKQYENTTTGRIGTYYAEQDRLKAAGVIAAVGVPDSWMNIDVNHHLTTPAHIHHHDFLGHASGTSSFTVVDTDTINSMDRGVLPGRPPIENMQPDDVRNSLQNPTMERPLGAVKATAAEFMDAVHPFEGDEKAVSMEGKIVDPLPKNDPLQLSGQDVGMPPDADRQITRFLKFWEDRMHPEMRDANRISYLAKVDADVEKAPADILGALGRVGAMPAKVVPRNAGENAWIRSTGMAELNRADYKHPDAEDSPYLIENPSPSEVVPAHKLLALYSAGHTHTPYAAEIGPPLMRPLNRDQFYQYHHSQATLYDPYEYRGQGMDPYMWHKPFNWRDADFSNTLTPGQSNLIAAYRQGALRNDELPPTLREPAGPLAGINGATQDWQPRPGIGTVYLKTAPLLKLFGWTDRLDGTMFPKLRKFLNIVHNFF